MEGRKLLTLPEQRQEDYTSFIEGCKGTVLGVGIGIAASAVSYRFSGAFRALSRPYQFVMISSGGMSGYLFASERAGLQFKNAVLGHVDHKTMDRRVYQSYKSLPREPRENVMRFLNDNRWTILGATWATSMLGAYSYNFSVHKHLSFKQKLFHARIYAQVITLAALVVSAGLSWHVEVVDKKLLREMPEGKFRAVLELPLLDQKKQQILA